MNNSFKTHLENFVNEVNEYRQQVWDIQGYTYKPSPDPVEIVEGGRKYVKLKAGGSVWGFVSMVDGMNKGSMVREGDLLKPAGWNSPAKHSRGNIIDGTARYEMHGPVYLK